MEEIQLMDALRQVSGRYDIADFHVGLLKRHIEQDIRILDQMLCLVKPITADQDAKLQTLKAWLSRPPLSEGKRFILTQYADTARYL